jgi:hypothetical protein
MQPEIHYLVLKNPSFQYIRPHPISLIHLNIILHLVRRLLTDLLYQPRTIDDAFQTVGGMRIGKGNRSTCRKPAQIILSTTNPTRLDLGSIPGRRGGKPATNRLHYGVTIL